MLPLAIFLICTLFWYVPIYRKGKGSNRPSGWFNVLAIVFGMIPVSIVVLILQIGLTNLLRPLPFNKLTANLTEAFLMAAIVEETVKYLFGSLVVRMAKPINKADYALLFGAVGMGFQMFESFMDVDSIFSAVLAGALAYHIIWQYWMGMEYYEYKNRKQPIRLVSALLIPIILHGINDFIVFMNTDALDSGNDEQMIIWTIVYGVFLLVLILFTIITMKRLKKATVNKKGVTTEEK